MDGDKAFGVPPKADLTPEQFRDQMRYAVVVIVIVMVILTMFNIWYTNDTAKEQEKFTVQQSQLMCNLLEAIDVPPQKDTPERVKEFYRRLHKYRVGLGCVRA